MDHEHIDVDGIEVSRDLAVLIDTAKRGALSTKEQVEIGYALEIWHNMAIKCERAIHRIAKGEAIS